MKIFKYLTIGLLAFSNLFINVGGQSKTTVEEDVENTLKDIDRLEDMWKETGGSSIYSFGEKIDSLHGELYDLAKKYPKYFQNNRRTRDYLPRAISTDDVPHLSFGGGRKSKKKKRKSKKRKSKKRKNSKRKSKRRSRTTKRK